MSKIHLEIFDKDRQEVYKLLTHFKPYGYLAGGTALSLQINHRKSFDFDIFVYKPISTKLRLEVKRLFGNNKYYVNSEDQMSFALRSGINLTFLWYYYPPLFSFIQTDSIPLSSVRDIAADKAHTIGRRAVWRDYVDFFFLFKKDIATVETVISDAKKKFKGEFNETLFLQQLSYFKDIRESPIEFIGESYPKQTIQSFLAMHVESYLKKVLNKSRNP